MKCGYNKCKCGGIVEKEVAVKLGNRYYHKDCYEEKKDKQEIEEYYLNNMPQTTLVMLRKVINQLIEKNGYNTKYILFTIKYIVKNKKPINSPFGLVNYCNDKRIFQEYKNIEINNKYNNIKKEINKIEIYSKVNYKYKPSKRITDLI